MWRTYSNNIFSSILPVCEGFGANEPGEGSPTSALWLKGWLVRCRWVATFSDCLWCLCGIRSVVPELQMKKTMDVLTRVPE